MRVFSDSFIEANSSESREPIFVAKIINDNYNIYVSSKNVVIDDIGAQFFQGVISSAAGNSQKIVPERGFSTIGSVSIELNDVGFTELLRDIEDNFGDSINDNKTELYYGYEGQPFDDFALIIPMYVSGIANNDTSFTLTLSDTQRISKKSIFTDISTTGVITSIRTRSASDAEPLTLEVISTDGFEDVLHDSTWEDAPDKRVGYLKVYGNDILGNPVKEIMRWEGKTATEFNITKRGVFGTSIVDLVGINGTDGNGEDAEEVEVEEVIYLDLAVPKMIIALLTGDLYGQVGERIPDSWTVNISSTFIDIQSYVDIGGDLWDQNLQFIDMEKEESKEFIAEQCLAPFGLFNYVNQNGEFFLKRFSFQSQVSASDLVLSNESLINVPTIDRNFKTIRNNFLINWEWRVDKDFYARRDAYIDLASQQSFNVSSDTYEINLRGIKNRDSASKPVLDYVAQGIATRFSNPSIKITVTGFLKDLISLEVGDTVTLDLPNTPDYSSQDTLLASFEVQGASWNFLEGTATLDLFTSTGEPSVFQTVAGANVTTINHTGWTDLASTGYGVSSGGLFTFNANANIASGKYYFDGDILFPDGNTFYANGSVFVDGNDITIGANAIINGVGRGVVGGQGYFGGQDAAQEGIKHDRYGFLNGSSRFKRRYRPAAADVPSSNSSINFPFITRINDGDSISGILPSKLYGNGGSAGLATDTDNAAAGSDPAGGAAVAGGAGIMFICNNLFYSSSSQIDLSGSDNNIGDTFYDSNDRYWNGGASGFGWPGVCIALIKDQFAPLPALFDILVAKTGSFSERAKQNTGKTLRPWIGGDWREYTPGDADFYPQLKDARSKADTDFALEGGVAYRASRLIAYADHTPEPGVDNSSNAEAPVLTLTPFVNRPLTPNGDQVTITVTAEPQIGDTAYLYSVFEYRALGSDQWVPITYAVSSEASVIVTADGSSYEFKATAYNRSKVSGGISTAEITVANVTKDPNNSDGDQPDENNIPEEIKVPPIRRLELVNRLDNDEGWNKFKSPNAEFRWAKTSVTNGGNIITVEGSTDLHLEGYKVRVYKADGSLLREETVKDSFYTYTFDKNKKDTNGSPVRQFKIDVQPVSSTGFVVTPTEIEVENPAPAAVTNISYEQTKDGIQLTYTPPSDIDFFGVKVRGVSYTGSSIIIPKSTSREEDLTVVSSDQFGDGESTVFTIENPEPIAPTNIRVDSGFTTLTVNFTPDDDFDFVGTRIRYKKTTDVTWSSYDLVTGNNYVIDNLVSGESYTIELTSVDLLGSGGLTSVVASTKLIESTALAPITTTVEIDESGGRLITNNSGYVAFHGATSAPTVSANPLIFGAYNGSDYPFWINAAGEFSFGLGEANLSFKSGNLRLGREATFDGNDSYNTELLYRNLKGFTELDVASTKFSISTANFNSGAGLKCFINTSGTSSARVEFFTNYPYESSYLNFEKETRMKVLILAGGNAEHDDNFEIVLGGVISNFHSAIVLGFEGTGTAYEYNITSGVRNDNSSYVSMPTGSLVGSKSATQLIDMTPADTTFGSVTEIEIVYIPADTLSEGQVKIYINGTYYDILSFQGSNNVTFNAGFGANLPFYNGSPFEIYQLPYFSLLIKDGGSVTNETAYYIGSLKIMNGESPLKT